MNTRVQRGETVVNVINHQNRRNHEGTIGDLALVHENRLGRLPGGETIARHRPEGEEIGQGAAVDTEIGQEVIVDTGREETEQGVAVDTGQEETGQGVTVDTGREETGQGAAVDTGRDQGAATGMITNEGVTRPSGVHVRGRVQTRARGGRKRNARGKRRKKRFVV